MLFPPEPLAKYPHLRPNEAELMTEYITLYGKEYKAFEYDVLVGNPPEPPQGTAPELVKDWMILASLKIDAVGHKEDEIHIIELKETCKPQDVLQVATYAVLYQDKYKPKKRIKSILVTRFARPDANNLANLYMVEVRLVP
jgi:hypothetical protein